MPDTPAQPTFATAFREGKTVVTRNGHTMFPEDVAKELLFLQTQNAELRASVAKLEGEQG